MSIIGTGVKHERVVSCFVLYKLLCLVIMLPGYLWKKVKALQNISLGFQIETNKKKKNKLHKEIKSASEKK